MRIKVLLTALFCAVIGIPVVVMGCRFDPPIWDAVAVGALATVVGPYAAGLVLWDLTRSRKGVAAETALDIFRP